MQPTASPEPLTVADHDTAEDDLLDAAHLPSVDEPRRAPALATGVVRGVASGILVDLPGGPALARRAKSCLVGADVGDRVLCAVDGGEVFILAVLEGKPGAPTTITAEGDLAVQATGRLGLAAGDHVDIKAAQEVGIFAGKLQLRAQAAVAAIEELGLVGRSVEAHLQSAVVAVASLETRADRILQRAKKALRFVETVEQVRAGVVDVRAENLVAIRGETTVVAARTMAKLDGEQVKIG